jgi:hypothetical protein
MLLKLGIHSEWAIEQTSRLYFAWFWRPSFPVLRKYLSHQSICTYVIAFAPLIRENPMVRLSANMEALQPDNCSTVRWRERGRS